MENKDYHCNNGAWHSNICCGTCWNKHPDAIQGKCFLGSDQHTAIIKELWLNDAREAGFTQKQAEFLYNTR